jgi:hypothetical protein
LLVRNSFKNYIWNLGASHNCKEFWKFINSRISSSAPLKFIFQNKVYEGAKNIAGAFSSCFKENFAPIDSNPDLCPPIKSKMFPIMEDIVCVPEIVQKLLSNIKSHASPGPDGIPAVVLKKCAPSLSWSLCCFFNYSLKKGEVPYMWKQARVIPVFKSGDRANIENYRPISVTSLVSKLLEKIIAFHILEHLRNNNLLNINQHGFIPKRSCISMLTHVLDEWAFKLATHNYKQIDIINLDWAKAFDTVPHKRLISKLWSYKIRNSSLSWIRSFLTGRTQVVVYRGEVSESVNVTSGVCQGSVIGPLLFAVYMLDLPSCVDSEFAQYADDSSMYRTINNNEDVEMLQKDLLSVEYWCKVNDMSLNAKKSTHLSVSKSHNNIPTSYSVNSTPIVTVNEVKCLGVNITDDMKWNNHTDIVVAKAYKLLGMLRRSLSGTRRAALRCAYLTLVRPLLLYGTPAWHPNSQQNLCKLERVQNTATRLILGREAYYYVNGVKNKYGGNVRNNMCNLPSISDLLYRQDVSFLHKCMLGIVDLPVFSDNRITVRSKPSKLRGGNSTQLIVPTINVGYYNNSFFPRSVALYNKLPESIKSLSIKDFQAKI